MKQFKAYILFLVLAVSGSASAQVIDTTIRINAWKLMHNYSRFEDTEVDTSTFRLHQNFNPLYRVGNMYESTGTMGHAAQNLDFFERPGTTDFLFGPGYYSYLANPDNTIFYNTRSPFTELIYSNTIAATGQEESVRLMHTQNMDPFSNIGLDFELLSSKENYVRELSRTTRISIFGNRTKDKYSAFGTFHYNSFNSNENGGLNGFDEEIGGLVGRNGFLKDSLTDDLSYDVNLGEATSGYRNVQLFYTQKYKLKEKTSTTDTLGITTTSGRNMSINHQFQAIRNKRFYEDVVSLTNRASIYDNFYYRNSEIKDSVVQDKLANTIQIILGDPYTDRLSARVYAGHAFVRYGQQSPVPSSVVVDTVLRDTVNPEFSSKFFNELFVGFHMAGPPENDWYWNIDGKYYVAGYYRNNFVANATFSRALTDSLRLGLRGSIENRNVSYYHNHYSSAFFQWDNDFDGSQIIKGEAFLRSQARRFEASVTLGMLTNYIYWNENALPVQHDQVMYIVSGKLNKSFTAGGFNSINQLLLQYTTENDVLRLPLAALKTSNYWENGWFSEVLFTELGFDLFITSPYLGNAYMPATGRFYLQNEQTIGGYPFLDLFLAMRLKRARLFISYNNVLSGLVSNNYFTLSDYPTKPRYIGIGLGWTFYD